MVRDLTQGRPLKLILQVTVPLVFGNLFQQLYNMADTIIVGQFLGKGPLAAVGATGCLNFLIIGFVLGVCSGFSIPISQCFGAGDEENLRRYVANAIWLGLGITVVLTGLTVLSCRWILQLLQTPADIFEDAYAYISVIFGGIGATFLYNLLSGFLRALGDSKSPLIFLVISSILNIGLDILFIVSFESGVAGAAWATVISQGISGVLCLIFILKKFPILRVRKGEWRLSRAHAGKLMGMGCPMGLQFSITAVGSTILQSAVNALGSDAVAAITAASKVQMILTVPMESLGVTMATYAGQNLGAGKISRVKAGVRQAMMIGVGYSVVACVLGIVAGTGISRLFLDGTEAEIFARIKMFLTANGCFYPLLASLLVLRNSVQGLGYGVPAMAAGVFEMVARSLVALCLVGNFGYHAVCFANPAAWVAANLLLVPVYIKVLKALLHSYPAEIASSGSSV